jgi:hypothetical protein
MKRRWCEYTSRSLDEARALGWQTAIHPRDLPALRDHWTSLIAFGRPENLEDACSDSTGSIAAYRHEQWQVRGEKVSDVAR